jgi:hypothetical protein
MLAAAVLTRDLTEAGSKGGSWISWYRGHSSGRHPGCNTVSCFRPGKKMNKDPTIDAGDRIIARAFHGSG